VSPDPLYRRRSDVSGKQTVLTTHRVPLLDSSIAPNAVHWRYPYRCRKQGGGGGL